MLRRLMFVLGLALLIGGFTMPAAAQGNARVRIVHASPDAPAVDVFVGEQAVATNVPFFTASDYLDLPAGQARVRVAPTGAGAAAAVIDATLTLAAGQAYTVAAVNPVASISAEVYQDNLGAAAANKARVRVYHLSYDAPAVDVKVAGGPTLISNLAFPDASAEAEVDAGTYDLQVTPAGAGDVVIDLPNTELKAGTYYSVFAAGPLAEIEAELATFTLPEAGGSGSQPHSLPNTGAAENLSITLLALGAAALGAGLLLRRRVA